MVGRLIGGVGGTSPVMCTRDSTMLHNIFMADAAGSMNISRPPSPHDSDLSSVGGHVPCASPGSADGAGGGGSGGIEIGGMG